MVVCIPCTRTILYCTVCGGTVCVHSTRYLNLEGALLCFVASFVLCYLVVVVAGVVDVICHMEF